MFCYGIDLVESIPPYKLPSSPAQAYSCLSVYKRNDSNNQDLYIINCLYPSYLLYKYHDLLEMMS